MVSKENTEEISLQEIGAVLRKFIRFIFKNWLAILLAGLIGGASGYFISKLFKLQYTADLTFVLSSESKAGGLSGLASQFGLDFGSSSGNDVFSGENIITLFKSKKMIRLVLFKNPPTSNESLINILAKDLKLDKKWNKTERTKSLFPFPKDPNLLSPVQDSLFRELYNVIVEKLLAVSKATQRLESIYQQKLAAIAELKKSLLYQAFSGQI